MAKPISLASDRVTLAAFAVQSSTTFYNTVKSFRFQPDRVRDLIDELKALSGVLHSLTETVSGPSDVDLSPLDLPLLRCGNACNEFAQEIWKCLSRSGENRTSFRDWAKLRYMGDDIDGFRRLLAGYKSTFGIAIAHVNLRKSSVTAEAVKDYRDQIKTTTDDLEARLEGIDEKLEAMFKRNAASSASDSSELQLLKEERLSTQNCLQICAQLSDHIDQIRPNSTGSEAMPERVEDLQKCKDSLSRAATMLEGHMHDRIQRFIIKSKTVMTPEEVADLERLRDEWDTARQCVAICSTADSRLKESVSIIENYGTHDETVQFLASTGKTMHSRNRGYGRKMRQVGGHFNDTSVQQLSRDIASISRPDTVDGSLSSPGDASSDAQPAVKDEYEFRERYGEGFNLAPKSTLG